MIDAVDLDVVAGVLAEEDAVALGDVEFTQGAVFEEDAVAHGEDALILREDDILGVLEG